MNLSREERESLVQAATPALVVTCRRLYSNKLVKAHYGELKDVIQEALFYVWKNGFREFDKRASSANTYLCYIARRCIWDRVTRKKRRLLGTSYTQERLPEPEVESISLCEANMDMVSIISSLGDRDREIITRQMGIGRIPQSLREIALDMKENLNVIKARYHKIMTGLRNKHRSQCGE